MISEVGLVGISRNVAGVGWSGPACGGVGAARVGLGVGVTRLVCVGVCMWGKGVAGSTGCKTVGGNTSTRVTRAPG